MSVEYSATNRTSTPQLTSQGSGTIMEKGVEDAKNQRFGMIKEKQYVPDVVESLQQLWFPSQELPKIKTVNIISRSKGGVLEPQPRLRNY